MNVNVNEVGSSPNGNRKQSIKPTKKSWVSPFSSVTTCIVTCKAHKSTHSNLPYPPSEIHHALSNPQTFNHTTIQSNHSISLKLPFPFYFFKGCCLILNRLCGLTTISLSESLPLRQSLKSRNPSRKGHNPSTIAMTFWTVFSLGQVEHILL